MKQMHPRQSLRKLKTAFSNSSPPSRSPKSTSSVSPLSSSSTSSNAFRASQFDFGFDFANGSSTSLCPVDRAIRRKKSSVEEELDEEQRLVDDQLISLIEPRPRVGNTLGGIEEMLDGRV